MNYVEKFGLEELIIAIPSATSEQMNRIVSLVDTKRSSSEQFLLYPSFSTVNQRSEIYVRFLSKI